MDLNTVTAVVAMRTRADTAQWSEGAAWLAGGTWLFSEPQPGLRTLLDLQGFGWPPIACDMNGLRVAATCTLAQLHAFAPPPEFPALRLVETCCEALLGSFKVWNMATVGGNICLALPAGPMITLAVALGAHGIIWTADGSRVLKIADLVLGAQRTALAPGEILREIVFSADVLRHRVAHRRISLSRLGRSAAFLVGTRGPAGLALTVTASTRRPFRLVFDGLPSSETVAARIAARIPDSMYHDDIHGDPAWRRHLTYLFAEEIRAELCEGK